MQASRSFFTIPVLQVDALCLADTFGETLAFVLIERVSIAVENVEPRNLYGRPEEVPLTSQMN